MAARLELDARLTGTRRSHIVQEFFTNSGHFPLAIIFFEFLIEGVAAYLARPDLYLTLGVGILQAIYLGSARFRGKPRPLLGNLIAPALYTTAEVAMEGVEFFEHPHHIAYWLISFSIGLMQFLQLRTPARLGQVFTLVESAARTSIVLVMYWAFEAATHPEDAAVTGFLGDDSHLFMAVVIPLLGLFVGLAQITASRYLSLLRETAHQLRTYSEWFFGRDLLSHAVADPGVLTLQRRDRAVLFIDIRGFTRWSDSRSPEQVVSMLNQYFEIAESAWLKYDPIKIKLSADEIMLIFADVQTAVQVARDLALRIGAMLAREGLSAGIGVHVGPVVEGLLGSERVRGYDVIGDTVNTAKRLCDAASGGEVVLSGEVVHALGPDVAVKAQRQIQVKGKIQDIMIHSLCVGEEEIQAVRAGLSTNY